VEHPLAENAALYIVRVLKDQFGGGTREERVYQALVQPNGWTEAEIAAGLAYAENHGWIRRARGRVSVTPAGIDAEQKS
jgi:hypothetical protein